LIEKSEAMIWMPRRKSGRSLDMRWVGSVGHRAI